MADERNRGWRARLARSQSVPDGEVRVRPLAAVGWMLATVITVIFVTAGIWFWLLGVADQADRGTDRAQARLGAARVALAAGGGAGAGVGLMLAFRRQQHQEKATVLTDRDAVERRINDRYTAAIDQLGSDKLDVRLGGIYALERIAADSRRDHPAIIDVLCTFVREHTRPDAPYDANPVRADQSATDDPPQPSEPIPTSQAADVQAALTVIGRRTTEYDTRIPDLHDANLRGADLRGANLYGANLYGADLRGAHLYSANLYSADLRGANLHRANLRGADLRGTHLRGTHMYGANLRDANLYGTHLRGANLSGTHLRGTHLPGANLRGANLRDVNLHRANLRDVNLHRANLREANLSGANLRGANLSGANLREANLSDANVRGANLSDANLSNANLSNARHDSLTQWPAGFTPPPSAKRTDLPPGNTDAQ